MPIAPNFTVDQTDTHVQLEIAVPHIRVTDIQVVLTDENSVLHFASVPSIYLLVLNFAPHCFQEEEDEACNAKFDPILRNGTVRLELRKSSPGQWDNLDLLGRLQQTPKSGQTTNWLVSVEESSFEKSEDTKEGIQQSSGTYGFARMFKGIFKDLTRDGLAREMLELPWNEEQHEQTMLMKREADHLGRIHVDRRLERIKMECDKFDPDRYLGDTFGYADDYLYQCAIDMRPHWDNLEVLASPFDHVERSLMLSIPYPLVSKNLAHDDLFFPLVDILFAYAYDHLMTCGDPTVESAWTVSILSASLSALEDWSEEATTRQVIESSLRRSLVYPYIRCYDLSIHVMSQVGCIVRHGLRTVIRCLLQIRRILDRSELYYLGNKIFIDPYLAWLQNAEVDFDDRLLRMAEEIDRILAAPDLKDTIGLDLASFESTAFEANASGEGLSSEQEDDSDASSSVDSDDVPEEGLVTELSRFRIS